MRHQHRREATEGVRDPGEVPPTGRLPQRDEVAESDFPRSVLVVPDQHATVWSVLDRLADQRQTNSGEDHGNAPLLDPTGDRPTHCPDPQLLRPTCRAARPEGSSEVDCRHRQRHHQAGPSCPDRRVWRLQQPRRGGV